ncbi:MAG: RagB/SusD family nutrient uptake outer membrane protein [Bacteroidales bacterium]|jgi:hypothetical protein|nr:RagB/SusD family nutrient uptake outer membrane protein [Bacteroidales bacterium]
MKNTFIHILTAVAMTGFIYSCMGDLDTKPLDNTELTGNQVYSTATGYKGMLAKCYASLILTGQQGGDGGDRDISNMDEGYSGFTRCLFYLQEASTDEIAFHAGSSHGTKAMLFMNWNPSTEIISYPYYRAYLSIGYCNEFLRQCTEEKLKSRGLYDQLSDVYKQYRSEARLIRAYCYNVICDLYGSGPFIDETMETGIIPKQKTRKEIFDYAVSESLDLMKDLPDAGQGEYGRTDKAAAWFLLARMYLNAYTWTGEDHYADAYEYSTKIIKDGSHPLEGDYRNIFLADNSTCREIIWGLDQDADNAQGSAGTNFLIKALVNGSMNNYYLTGIGTRGWGNCRAKTNLVNLFDGHDQTFNENDPWGDGKYDKRAQFFSIGHTKNTWAEGQGWQKDFTQGYAIIKWRNVTKNREELAEGGTVYSSVDYPLFRTADAYLMAAEAILRGGGGTRSEALSYVNEVRDRAYLSGKYGNSPVSGGITDSQLTLGFILDERGRELYTENIRRTDLIRFGKYTSGYNWDWKGGDGSEGSHIGKDVDDKYKLFPIPETEFTTNPNLSQNPDYTD